MIDLLRHGTTGRRGYLDGHTDRALTADGWAQFRAMTQNRGWGRIFASPLQRARAAAEALAHDLSCPLDIHAGWAEYNFGAWDGARRQDIERDAAGAAALAQFYANPIEHPPPDGERWPAYEARVRDALHHVLESGAETALVVTHAGPLRLVLSMTTGLPLAGLWAVRVDYASRVRLRVERGADGKPWAEIIEIAQPPLTGATERMP